MECKQWGQKKKEYSQDQQFRYALTLVGRQDYSEQQVREKLKKRDATQEQQDIVITELKKIGGVNDERFTETFIRQQQQRGIGPRLIQQKLYKKGIPKQQIEEGLHEYYPKEQQQECAQQALEKYERTRKDRRTNQQCMGHLAQKGFSQGVVFDIIDGRQDKEGEW